MEKSLIALNLTKEQLTYLVEILEENSDNGCSLGNLPSSSLWSSILYEASQALDAYNAATTREDDSPDMLYHPPGEGIYEGNKGIK